jgi:hypothetical protein
MICKRNNRTKEYGGRVYQYKFSFIDNETYTKDHDVDVYLSTDKKFILTEKPSTKYPFTRGISSIRRYVTPAFRYSFKTDYIKAYNRILRDYVD